MSATAISRQLRSYVARHRLLKPGDRLGVAVSGGLDSVALLRALLELRAELGIVLSAVHFNHKLRGEESNGDEQFVRDLATSHGLEWHVSEADTARFAREKELSIEAAARELRYGFFGRLIQDGTLDKVATAHTLDDQAETVLLRIFRGTGTSGLSGIHPRLRVGEGAVIRPLLWAQHRELVFYLQNLGQSWREDSTNSEPIYTRNRVRHQLIPFLQKSFNPEVVDSLANLADIARAEDEFWSAETAEAFVRVHRNQRLLVPELLTLPLAVRRRVLRLAAIQAGATLDFHHAERILDQLEKPHSQIELPNGFRAVVESGTMRFESAEPQAKPCGYSYSLPIPGEVDLPGLNIRIRTSVVTESENLSRYNDAPRLAPDRLPPELLLRNWRPGDRFWPVHTRSAKKVKELLQERHLPAREKALWPVAVAGDQIVWMRGFPAATEFAARQDKAVVIETLPLSPSGNN